MEIRTERPQGKHKSWNRSFENTDKQYRRDLGSRRNFDSEINGFSA